MAGDTLSDIRNLRIGKLEQLKKMGIDAYPARTKRQYSNANVVANYEQYQGTTVTIAGRLNSWRTHGHLVFADLHDQSGKIQLYIKDDVIQAHDKAKGNLGFAELNLIDINDIVEATGEVTQTKTGEISLLVHELKILTKSLRPLPNELNDKEERFRRRYLDMQLHPEVRDRFTRRSKFWQATRDFLNKNGFVEVNIPVLEHVTGGADAKPFVTHYDALNQDFFLRISHELPLKRLIGAGYEKVYDIGVRFRNEGFSDEHLPEHVAMEWYWAFADYRAGMEFTKELFRYVLKEVYGTLQFNMKGFEVDLAKDWEEIRFADVIKQRFSIDIFTASDAEMKAVLDKAGVVLPGDANRSRLVDNLWKLIRKTVAGPAFLIDVPKFLSPLAKSKIEEPQLTERFHPIIAGSELANAFSELNDPIDQLDRFLEQQSMRDSGDDEAQMLDIDFVEMLEYGMAPAVGFGMSERVFWFFENVTAKEGVPFPQLKHTVDEVTKKIYPFIKDEEVKPSIQNNKSIQSEKIAIIEGDTKQIRKQDHDHRMLLVILKDLQGWQLNNTVGQLSAFLGGQLGDYKLRTREKFVTKTGEINANMQYPLITMSANSSTQLYNLLQRVEELGLPHLAYTQQMIDLHDDEQLQQAYENTDKSQLPYLGIGIFGDNNTLKELTKKFSLWK